MMIQILKSKIHRAKVTEANINYIGSITIDEDLMDAANLIEGEKVQVVDINNGERLETYVVKGERHSGIICLNGAAARKVAVGDLVIIMGYGMMDFDTAKKFKPCICFPDELTNLLSETSVSKQELEEIISGHGWIKVKQPEVDPGKNPDIATIGKCYNEVVSHHIEETEFLINKCRELAKELLKNKKS